MPAQERPLRIGAQAPDGDADSRRQHREAMARNKLPEALNSHPDDRLPQWDDADWDQDQAEAAGHRARRLLSGSNSSLHRLGDGIPASRGEVRSGGGMIVCLVGEPGGVVFGERPLVAHVRKHRATRAQIARVHEERLIDLLARRTGKQPIGNAEFRYRIQRLGDLEPGEQLHHDDRGRGFVVHGVLLCRTDAHIRPRRPPRITCGHMTGLAGLPS